MYQVIILLNKENQQSYYQSYIRSDDTTLGNISTNELPPYQDILKAQACWWDFDTQTWVYDEKMYQKLVADEEQKEAEEKQRRLELKAQLTNEEIAQALMEIGRNQSDLFDTVSEISKTLDVVTKTLGGEK